jgi:hypothetical protein
MIGSEGDVLRYLDETLSMSRSRTAILEGFVPGVELNVLLAMRGGEPTLLTASDRLRPGGLGFGVGWIHSFPSALPAHVLDEVREVSFAATRALGLRDGIAFPQLIAADDGGVVVVEVAARIAAGQMADLVRLGTGIELFDIAIAQALGRAVPDAAVSPRFVRPIAIRFLTASPGVLPVGTVSAVDGLDDVRSSPGVLDCGLYFDVGSVIHPLQVDADRSGFVIATGDTPAVALVRANEASHKLVVRTRETEAQGGVPKERRRRRFRTVALVTLAAVVVATGTALVVTDDAKLQRPLVSGTRVDKLFAPVCACRQDVAHLQFRLTQRARVTIGMSTQSGRTVTTFVRDRMLGPGLVRLAWSGRRRGGQPLADGTYFPQVDFVSIHRLLRLPSPIRIDDRRPRIVRVSVDATGRALLIRYTFDMPAHAALFAARRRVIFTRFASRSGSMTWRGSSAGLGIQAVDLAGNRSGVRPIRAGPVRTQ